MCRYWTVHRIEKSQLTVRSKGCATIAERLLIPAGQLCRHPLTLPAQTSKTALDEALEQLLSAPDRKPEDLTLIYFSCHGDVYADDNTFCLLPSNATLHKLMELSN